MIGGFAVPAGPGFKAFIAEVDPASLAIMNAMGFTGGNTRNDSRAVTGCGAGFVCLTGGFRPTVGFASATLVNAGGPNDGDVFFARVARP